MSEDSQPPQPPVLPAPPPAEMTREAADSLVGYLCKRVEDLQKELDSSQRSALEAHGMLRHQEALREEVESRLKSISDQLRREKAERDQEAEKMHARGRVDALEKRLDEMHQSWAELLKEAIAAKEGAAPRPESVEEIKEHLDALRERLNALPKLSLELQELKARLPEHQERRVAAMLEEHFDEFKRLLALELQAQRDRTSTLAREQSNVEGLLRDELRQWQQHSLQERADFEARWQARLEGLQQALAGAQAAKRQSVEQGAEFKALAERFLEAINRPPQAKDEMISALAREKEELMQALRDRNRELQGYVRERREVEQSLGESLLKLGREFEEERSRHMKLESRISELQSQIQSAEFRLGQAHKENEEKDRRLGAISAERDELAKALMAEAEKVRLGLRARSEMDRQWESRFQEANARAEMERQRRLELEGTVGDLRSQLKTLSEHLARALQEKESSGDGSWRKEKEELLTTLRKKEEMISMLSSTFQNLLQKPAPPEGK